VDWLLDRFASAPNKVAFAHGDAETTYGTILASVERFRDQLRQQNIQPGDRVAVLGDFSPDVFCLMIALSQNGSITIPLTRDSVIEVSTALAVSGCEWFTEFDSTNTTATFREHRVHLINPLIEGLRERKAPGMVFFSSGSTGTPKGILHDINRVAEKFRVQRAAPVAISFLMLDHFGGLNTLLAITSSLGTVVTVRERSVTEVCRAIERRRVNLLPATPSFLTLLMASGAHKKFDLSSLARITYGTEVMPQATLARLREAFPGVELQQTYGLSELGVLRSQSRDDGSLWMRIGGTGFETKVVDGILWIRSDFAMLGYLNAPSNFDADGWFNTQDRVDVDGEYFRILGRSTDLINVGGQKVYPAEIEDVILELDNIEDVAVSAEAHPMLGQIVVAKVATIEPEELASLKARIRVACKARLASFKVPSKVLLADGSFHSARHKKLRQGKEG
jgi:acyl-CoA synthetase (AMP-forming)/AMP-acid ligase II